MRKKQAKTDKEAAGLNALNATEYIRATTTRLQTSSSLRHWRAPT